jgi:hypothetical protein
VVKKAKMNDDLTLLRNTPERIRKNYNVAAHASPIVVKTAQMQFGVVRVVNFERLPNELAAHANSRIMIRD